MVDPVALRLGGSPLERLAGLVGLRVAQQAPAQVVATGGVERSAERLPRGAGLSQRGARLVWIGRPGTPGLEARCLADRVTEPVGEPLCLVGGFPRRVRPLGESQIDGARRDRLDRLSDEAGALAEVESAGELSVGVGVVAALA